MEEWKEFRLGDIISIAGGFAYKGDLIGKGQNYLLGMGCVSFNENFLDKGARQYDGDCPERYYATPGDIVLATRQQSDNMPILGMPAIIPSKYEGCKIIVGANLYRVELKDTSFDNRFIYWLLKTPSYINYIRSCQSGTTVRMITKSNIEDFIFCAPKKEVRDRISNLIWTLDDKIEVNKRINENLEQQAQALFKSWFVDFEPFKN
jgi:type I restriction enzyme S subunit